MRLFLKLIAIIIAVCITSIPSFAALTTYQKDSQNPLDHSFFLLQTTGTFEDGIYKLWYTSGDGANLKIGYATSTNGVQWQGALASSQDPGDNHDPAYFKDASGSYLYYISEPAEGSGVNITIHRARVQNELLDQITAITLNRQPWNSQKLSCPYVTQEQGTYIMFYCGTAGGSWQLGMATSTDGVAFTACENNPTITGSNLGNSQFYMDESGKKYLIFHSDSGIEQIETTDQLGCSTRWQNRKVIIGKDRPYDQTQIISPTLITNNEGTALYYTGRGPGTSNNWRLLRAVKVTEGKHAVVLVPGYFASWSREGLLHNHDDGPEWYVPSFVTEYQGFIDTMHNLGYERDKDIYVFAYDWRKPIAHTSETLHQYIQKNVWDHDPSRKIDLVGHSFGGVLSRVYGQKHPSDQIGKIVTVGAPHRGVVQAYSPLEAGEVDRENSLFWLGTKLLIYLNKADYRADKDLVRALLPSLYDLFPTFDFVQSRRANSVKPVDSMSIQNTLLHEYNSNTASIDDKLTTIYGTKSDNSSPSMYLVHERTWSDYLLGIYPDGRPYRTIYESGDYLVPKTSSSFGVHQTYLPLDHNELIFNGAGIDQILQTLEIPHLATDIVEGKRTILSPSLVIVAQSPVEIELSSENSVTQEHDGIIVVPNAPTGRYTLAVTKQTPGSYRITLAQIATDNDVWEQFEGVIDEAHVGETDLYTIDYNRKRSTSQISKVRCKKANRTGIHWFRTRQCKIRSTAHNDHQD